MSTQLDLFARPLAAAPPSLLDVRGFTFWRPWVEAIAYPVPSGAYAPTPKRIDNRPPRSALASRVGRYIALHVGQTTHAEGLDWINATFGYGWADRDLAPLGSILGVARVVGRDPPGDPWHFGETYAGKPNEGWRLDDVVTFAEPLFGPGGAPIKGALGCWVLPDDVLAAVRERVAAARAVETEGADGDGGRGGDGC